MMRRILVDRARARKMAKRSGRRNRVSLIEDAATTPPRDVDVLDLDAALEELGAFDPRKARVAELRFFGGLSLEEIGGVLDTSLATTMRDWQIRLTSQNTFNATGVSNFYNLNRDLYRTSCSTRTGERLQ